MITENLIAERIAVEHYRELVRYFAEFDPTTRRMIEQILEPARITPVFGQIWPICLPAAESPADLARVGAIAPPFRDLGSSRRSRASPISPRS